MSDTLPTLPDDSDILPDDSDDSDILPDDSGTLPIPIPDDYITLPFFHVDIWNVILPKLSAKHLIKCTLVSKSFKSFITNPHNTKTLFKQHLLIRYSAVFSPLREFFHIEADDYNHCFTGFQNREIPNPLTGYPFFKSGRPSNIAGCVNGVLCLFDDFPIYKYKLSLKYKRTIITLYNPTIRKFCRLPISKPTPSGDYSIACGFGFDPISTDYKVVKIVSYELDASEICTVEVYSLKVRAWRRLDVALGPVTIKMDGYCCHARCINGKIYWVAARTAPSNLEFVILQFDISAETFYVIELHGVVNQIESTANLYSNLYPVEYKGSLALFKPNYGSNYTTCTAWLMIENGVHKSWEVLLHLDICPTKPRSIMRAFAFTNSGKVLMVRSCDEDAYSHKEQQQHIVSSVDLVTKIMTIHREIPAIGYSFYLSTYDPSMVLFNEGRSISGYFSNKEDEKEVITEKVVVNKGKCITTAKGLENFGVKLADTSEKLGNEFATGASVVMEPTKEERIDVEGDIAYDFLMDTWLDVPENVIYFIEDGREVPAALDSESGGI